MNWRTEFMSVSNATSLVGAIRFFYNCAISFHYSSKKFPGCALNMSIYEVRKIAPAEMETTASIRSPYPPQIFCLCPDKTIASFFILSPLPAYCIRTVTVEQRHKQWGRPDPPRINSTIVSCALHQGHDKANPSRLFIVSTAHFFFQWDSYSHGHWRKTISH